MIKISSSHVVTKYVSEVVKDADFIESLDKKSICTLTYIATNEKMMPKYSITTFYLDEEVNEYIFKIKSREDATILTRSCSEIINDRSILLKLSSLDSSRIGYCAGMKGMEKQSFNQVAHHHE